MNNSQSQSSFPQVLRAGQAEKPNSRCWGWPSLTALMLLIFGAGCSGQRKPTEDVDWGLPKPSVVRRPPPRQPRPEPAGAEAASALEGKGEESGDSQGISEKGGGGDLQNMPNGSDSSTSGGGDAPGEGADPTGGVSDIPLPAEPERPAPVLPGREPGKPELSADEAAKSAKQLLKRAQQLLRDADNSAAAEAAIKAYDQVLPHAESHAECKRLRGQLEGVLNAAGRGRGRADAVPTRFE
jgi:hypothetical protein